MESKSKFSGPSNGSWDEQKIKLMAKYSSLTYEDLMFEENKKEEMLERISKKLRIPLEELNTILSTL